MKRFPLNPGDRLIMVIRDVNGRVEASVRQSPDTLERRAGALRVAFTTLAKMAQDEGPEVVEALKRYGLAAISERRIEP